MERNDWCIGGKGKDFTTSIMVQWYENEVKKDLEFEKYASKNRS